MEPLESSGFCLCRLMMVLTGQGHERKNRKLCFQGQFQLGNEDPQHFQGVYFLWRLQYLKVQIVTALHAILDSGCYGRWFYTFAVSSTALSLYITLNLFFYMLKCCKFLLLVGLSLIFTLFVLLCYAQTCKCTPITMYKTICALSEYF